MRWKRSLMLYLAFISSSTYNLIGALLALAGVAYAVTLMCSYGSNWAEHSVAGQVLTFPVQVVDPILPDRLQVYWMRNAAVTRKYGTLKGDQVQAEIDKSWIWLMGLTYIIGALGGLVLGNIVLPLIIARTAGRQLLTEFRLLHARYRNRPASGFVGRQPSGP